MDVKIIGFCGTAKNTGKTTTMKVILDAATAKKQIVALTSIGYDGELVDHVTGLPKPRIYALPGTLLAIADSCAKGSTAEIEILQRTQISTALGKVVIGRVRKPGLILLAGPTKSVEIRKVNGMLAEAGAELILVDGALNRIAPMVETQGIIMATGASRNTDIDELVSETAAIAATYQLPKWNRLAEENVLESGSILDEVMTERLLEKCLVDTETIRIQGIIGARAFSALIENGLEKIKGKKLVLADPTKLLVSGSPTQLHKWMGILEKEGVKLLLERQLPLRLITINPFYPQYRYASHDYEAAYVDKQRLKSEMLKHLKVPVVNVLEESEETMLAYAVGKNKE